MKNFFNILLAILKMLSYKAVYTYYQFDGIKFKYACYFKARWYSILFWIFVLIMLPINLIFNANLVQYIKDILYEIKGNKDEISSFSGEFKQKHFLNKWYLTLTIYKN